MTERDQLVLQIAELRGHDTTRGFDSLGAHLEPLRKLADEILSRKSKLIDGRYELLDKLGEGGMAVVFRARDLKLNRFVALKGLGRTDPIDLERFTREARTAAQLRHPSIVEVYDIVTDGEQTFITMKYIEGQTLRAWPVAVRQKLEALVQAADGLHHAHQEGVIHRDVKPDNILVDRQGRAYLSDFGLARRQKGGTRVTRSGMILGTPGYMSPEQARSVEVDARSDVYGLGATLYEILAGTPPFGGSSEYEVLAAVVERDPEPPKGPRELQVICLKALAKEADRRYPTAEAFAADVRRYLAGEAIQARPPSVVFRLTRFLRRRKQVVIPTVVALVLALVFGAWSAHRRAKRVKECLTAGAALEAEGRLEEARDAYAAGMDQDAVSRIESRLKESATLLEGGRTALDQAFGVFYNPNAGYEELVKRVEPGQALIEKAIEKTPRSALAYHLLGRAWEIKGWDDKAEAAWRRAVELDPDFGPAHYQLGRLLLVRSFLETVGVSEEDRDRAAAERYAEEAGRELDAAMGRSGLDDALQREVAATLIAYARRETKIVLQKTIDGVTKFKGQPGVEEFYWLSGLALSGKAQRQAYDNALLHRAKYPLVSFCRALARHQSEELDGAIADFDEALKIKPRFVESLMSRGYLHNKRGVLRRSAGFAEEAAREFEAAIADASEVLRLDPGRRHALINRGLARAASGDHDGAIADCDAVLRLDPKLAEAWLNRAESWASKKEYDRAMADYAEALRLRPRWVHALINRGSVHALRGDDEAAMADYEAALKIDPRSAMALYNRAVQRGLRGDVAGAMRDYTEALTIDPAYVNAWSNRAALKLRSGDFDGAIADSDEALKVNPRYLAAFINRGAARAGKGDSDGAIRDYDASLKIDPRYAEAFSARGLARLGKGDVDGALVDLDEAVKNAPKSPDVLNNRAFVRLKKQDWDGAIADCDEVLKLNPRHAPAFNNRANARGMKGDFDGAIADCDAALKIEPRNPYSFTIRGMSRRAKGDVPGAIEDFEAALRAAPRTWPVRKTVEDYLKQLKP